MDSLSAAIPAFCSLLRTEHGFGVGAREAHESLRALACVGISDPVRVRSALRLTCCTTRAETAEFDSAFDRFFTPTPPGVAQPAYAPRHTRPGRDDMPAERGREQPQQRDRVHEPEDDPLLDVARATGRPQATSDESDDAPPGTALVRARYSPLAARSEAPLLAHDDDAAMRAAAARAIAAMRLGRSRRWCATEHGGRFDFRRTVRASLQTGGEPLHLRQRGHPLRNPCFVVLIDGSRSVADRTAPIVAFARALVARSLRAHVFFFSTELSDVTRALRASLPDDAPRDLGNAWGGGTKIGASLAAFVDAHGDRVLSHDTVVIVFSDGLDVGDLQTLARAMRDIERRSAGIVWLNPHASMKGFAPTARGMRVALPYVTILTSADSPREFERLADTLARHPGFRKKRR